MILLTHAYFLKEDPRELGIMKPYVPLGLLYLSAFLTEKGLANDVYDSTFSDFDAFRQNLLLKKPKILGVYTNLMTKISVLRIIRLLQTEPELKDIKIILGGPEIRYNAENYLTQGAHMLVIGEGEVTFYEICRYFSETGQLPLDVKGTAYLSGNETAFTPERELIRDVDQLPMPARHKVNLNLYAQAWKDHHGYSMFSVSTMRGCPYTCKWCSRAVYGGTYRRRNAKLVVDELEQLKKNYSPDRIWFVDDVFTINHKWLREFRDELIKRKIFIPYEIITRADRMNEEVIAILRETGCFRVWIGAESGSQRIIDAMDRRVKVEMVGDMIRATRKAGMEAGTFIMLGYPGEQRIDIQDTIRHLKRSAPDTYTVTIAYPITGTPLYQEVNDSLTANGSWKDITDRDYDFKRSHSRRYYDYAIRWVANEVNGHREPRLNRKIKFKLKSVMAQALMLIS